MIKLDKIKSYNNFDKITCILCNQLHNKSMIKHECKLRNLYKDLKINNK